MNKQPIIFNWLSAENPVGCSVPQILVNGTNGSWEDLVGGLLLSRWPMYVLPLPVIDLLSVYVLLFTPRHLAQVNGAQIVDNTLGDFITTRSCYSRQLYST